MSDTEAYERSPARGALRVGDAQRYKGRHGQHGGQDGLPQQQASERQAQERMEQLQLSDTDSSV